jgi:hypothetical protein
MDTRACLALFGTGRRLATPGLRQHRAVRGQLQRLLDGEGAAVLGGGPAGPAFQVGECHGDHQLTRQARVVG